MMNMYSVIAFPVKGKHGINPLLPFHAFDIETNAGAPRFKYPNNSESLHPGGLDPRVAEVITASAVGSDGSVFVVDSLKNEKAVIESLLTQLSCVNQLVGWNTTFFDVPFLRERSLKFYNNSSVYFTSTSTYEPKYGFSEWHDNARRWNSVDINGINVVDIAPLFKDVAASFGVKHSLRPVAEALGLNPVNVDASEVHLLTPEERMKYCVSDSETVVNLMNWLIEND